MREHSTISYRKTIPAEWLLTQLIDTEEPVFTLRCKNISGKLDLKYRTVHAAIDIQECQFLDEVDVRHCEFEQVVNLSRCTFHQGLRSGGERESRTVYKKDLVCYAAVFDGPAAFNGAHIEGHAVFANAEFRHAQGADFTAVKLEGQLLCPEANFRGSASFDSLKCEDAGVFHGTTFGGETSYIYASFGSALECMGATFGGSAFFNRLTCSTLDCSTDEQHGATTFKGLTKFDSLQCDSTALFNGAKFEGEEEVIFGFASFGSSLECIGANFRGSASFNSLKCEGPGFFHGTTFGGAVDFVDASFGSALECMGATFGGSAFFNRLRCSNISFNAHEKHGATTFKGPASFDSLKCEGTAFFNGAKFEGEEEVIFGFAFFGSGLECIGATFTGRPSFNSLKCEGPGSFDEATFKHGVEYDFASFGQGLSCNLAFFEGSASFFALKCAGDGNFSEAEFTSRLESDFTFSNFGGSLYFTDSRFLGSVRLEAAQISRKLDFTARGFAGVSLYNATVGILVLGKDPRPLDNLSIHTDRFPFVTGSLDLRGFIFESFDGSKPRAMKFIEAQNPRYFSRDPYLQLERYYESVGQDIQARDVHFRGRRAARENASRGRKSAVRSLARNLSTRLLARFRARRALRDTTNADSDSEDWSLGVRVSDWLLRVLTGYGVYTSRIIWPILFFVIFGAMVFSIGEALSVSEGLAVKASQQSTEGGKIQTLPASKTTIGDGILYSVDRFIPVNMGVEEEFEPSKWWSHIYSHIHALAGWLLIPLFLASWSGLMRSRQ